MYEKKRTLSQPQESLIFILFLQEFTGLYHLSHIENPANKRHYESTIYLIDINHYYVGEFNCIHNDSLHEENLDSLKSDFKISGIYVYVNGTMLTIYPSICFGYK